ncbi:MAG: hypothetical protein ACOX87_01480 [Chloroflexota bacterium]|jgi:hypothetical protein
MLQDKNSPKKSPMMEQYPQALGFVQHLAPTWRKTQHRNLAQLLVAILDHPTLCLSQLACSMPKSDQPLHGRLKRLMRFLENPRLDEAALFVRWLKLSYRFGDDAPQLDDERPILPLLLDTTYFDPLPPSLPAFHVVVAACRWLLLPTIALS